MRVSHVPSHKLVPVADCCMDPYLLLAVPGYCGLYCIRKLIKRGPILTLTIWYMATGFHITCCCDCEMVFGGVGGGYYIV